MISKRHFPKFKIVISSLLILSILSSYGLGMAGFVFAAPKKDLVQTTLTQSSGTNNQTTSKKVVPTTRNLAMFAALTYADLENISGYNIKCDTNVNGKSAMINPSAQKKSLSKSDLTFKSTNMVSDAQLKKIKICTTVSGINLLGLIEDTYETAYEFLFNGLASTTEVNDWKIMNYAKYNSLVLDGHAVFTAMTFKKDNTIVIAYRGTDMDDGGDWGQDFIGYGLFANAGQEQLAQDYAKIVAQTYPSCDIYVTGHSLGGYLAQIGASSIVNKYKVKEISYFNGIGLKFWSNGVKNSKILKNIKKEIDNSNLLTNATSTLNKTQDEAMKNLNTFKNSGGKIVSHYTKGDWVSMLGTHVGDEEEYKMYYPLQVLYNTKNNGTMTALGRSAMTLLMSEVKSLCNKDISKNVDEYKVTSVLSYLLMTHKIDNFFGVLSKDGNGSNIEIKMDVPSNVWVGQIKTVTLTVSTKGVTIKNPNLSTSNFKASEKTAVKFKSISAPKKTTKAGVTTYTYTVTLEFGIGAGIPTDIMLIGNSIKLNSYPNTLMKTILQKDIILDSI